MNNKHLVRITTIPDSLAILLTHQMKFMKNEGFEVSMISANGNVVDELKLQEGCPHFVIPFTRRITPFADFLCLIKIIFLFLKIRPDIVHTHTPKAGLIGMLAAKIVGVKYRIHTIAGLPLMTEVGLKRKLLIFIEKLTYFSANIVHPNSKSLYDFVIINNLCNPNKLKTIGRGSSNGIDLESFDIKSIDEKILDNIKSRIKYSAENYYLLSVGRLVRDKGIEDIVNAFEKTQKKYKQLKLILIGNFEPNLDPLSKEIYEKIKSNSAIIHVGFTKDVKYYMNLSNLLVHASYREGFPNVLLQAGAMKCPIICSDIPGNIDIVEHQKTGLVFQTKDIDNLCASLEYAINNNIKLNEMKDALFSNIVNFYERKKFHKSIKEFYSYILSN